MLKSKGEWKVNPCDYATDTGLGRMEAEKGSRKLLQTLVSKAQGMEIET